MRVPGSAGCCVLLTVLQLVLLHAAAGTAGELETVLVETGYSKHNRPVAHEQDGTETSSQDGPAVEINLSVHLARLEPMSTEDPQEFRLTLTIRQSWIDERLEHNSSDGEPTVLERSSVWTPGLFYAADVDGPWIDLRDKVEASEDRVTVAPDGDVNHDITVVPTFYCPAAIQSWSYMTCTLRIASLEYRAKDVVLVWDSDYALTTGEQGSSLGEGLHFEGYKTDHCDTKHTEGPYSCIQTELVLSRWEGPGRLLLQAYLPLGLLVLLAHVALWAPAQLARPARLLGASLAFLLTLIGAALALLLLHAPPGDPRLALTCWVAACVALADLPAIALAVTICSQRHELRSAASRAKSMREQAEPDTPGSTPCSENTSSCEMQEVESTPRGPCGWCVPWQSLPILERATLIVLPCALLLLALAFWLVLRAPPAPPPDLRPLILLDS